MNWKTTLFAFLVLCGSVSFGAAQDIDPPKSRPLVSIDEIAHVYHGVILDKNFEILTLETEQIPALLQNAIDRLSNPTNSEGKRRIEFIQKSLETKAPLGFFAITALRGALLEDIIAKSSPAIKNEYGWKVEFLKARVPPVNLFADHAEKDILLELRDRLSSPGALNELLQKKAPGFLKTPQTYSEMCQGAGIPLPPNWNSGKWVLQGELPQKFNFLQLGNPVEVYAYNDPNNPGACIALPRWEKSKSTVTLGIICQSGKTGKACFWDNRPHGGGATFTPDQLNTTDILRDWVNGLDPALIGGGKCVMCHRGENAFIIHPDTPLQLAAPYDTDSPVWYEMINAMGWINPPATAFVSKGGCQGCHQIASTTDAEAKSYCAFLKRAADSEMPSQKNPATWMSPPVKFLEHINLLKMNCGSTP